MKKYILLLLLLVVGAFSWWLYTRQSRPPEIPFVKVKRERLVSTLSTNGKIEPLEWVAVRSERAGAVAKVHVQRGQRVSRGALLVELNSEVVRAELASAEARIGQARAELEVIEQGGRQADLAQIESDLARARVDLDVAAKEHAALARLAEKQAVTKLEVEQAAQRVQVAKLQIAALQKRRATLVTQTDRTAAVARLQEAEAAARVARIRIEAARIHSPLAGSVYDMELQPGAYVNPGDLLAKIGQTDRVRVRLYVDEPELGRVSTGDPVTITWDALQGKEWKGEVERMPTQIVSLGTRQVGEVLCVIDNPGGELLPGTNVNAEIQSAVVQNALTIPREALRRESGQDGVYLLDGGKIVWRPIEIGISSATRTQVVNGLAEGDSAALPAEQSLSDGLKVRPVYPG